MTTFIVTGATAGVGRATALALARRGFSVVPVARDRSRTAALASELASLSGCESAFVAADLSLVRECRRAAREVAELGSVDVVINNVGAVFPERRLTSEGLESTFALNHLGPFTLTLDLLTTLQKSAAPRVVNVSSQVHADSLDLGDLQGERDYVGLAAYRQSKLLNILFTRELHRRYGTWLLTGCLHPGVVATGLLSDYAVASRLEAEGQRSAAKRSAARRLAAGLKRALRPATPPASLGGIDPDEGAKTSLHVATHPGVADHPGAYWRECRVARPAAIADDEALAARVWELSLNLAQSIAPAPG